MPLPPLDLRGYSPNLPRTDILRLIAEQQSMEAMESPASRGGPAPSYPYQPSREERLAQARESVEGRGPGNALYETFVEPLMKGPGNFAMDPDSLPSMPNLRAGAVPGDGGAPVRPEVEDPAIMQALDYLAGRLERGAKRVGGGIADLMSGPQQAVAEEARPMGGSPAPLPEESPEWPTDIAPPISGEQTAAAPVVPPEAVGPDMEGTSVPPQDQNAYDMEGPDEPMPERRPTPPAAPQGGSRMSQSIPRDGGIASMKPTVPDPADDPDDADAKVQELAKQAVGAGPAEAARQAGGMDAEAPKQEAEDVKDAPEWAMPLIAMGLSMMASDNPDAFGALGEGGIAALNVYAKQKQQEREAKREARKEAREDRRDARDEKALDLRERATEAEMQNAAERLGITREELDIRRQAQADASARGWAGINKPDWEYIGNDEETGAPVYADQFGNRRSFDGVSRPAAGTSGLNRHPSLVAGTLNGDAHNYAEAVSMGTMGVDPAKYEAARQKFIRENGAAYGVQPGQQAPGGVAPAAMPALPEGFVLE